MVIERILHSRPEARAKDEFQQRLDDAAKPPFPPHVLQQKLDEWVRKIGTKYKNGLFIGRMQPPHWGHIWTILRGLALAEEKMTIVIGSSNVIDEKNPWSAGERKKMLRRALNRVGVPRHRYRILLVKDFNSDEQWLQVVNNKQGRKRAQFAIGDNPWVNNILRNNYHIIDRQVDGYYYERETYEGSRFRQLFRERGWLPAQPRTKRAWTLFRAQK